MATRPARSRRTKNHWEPFYRPDLTQEFSPGDWAMPADGNLTFQTFTAQALEQATGAGLQPHFTEKHFTDCDFTGYFDRLERPISFTRCSFTRCDFGTSTWKKVKFSKCRFEESSFTQCTIINGDFIKCTWHRIGFSGTETDFRETYISNPAAFVNSRWVDLSPDFVERHKQRAPSFVESHADAVLYAAAMHETSKEVMGRMIFHGLKSVGDEATFYEAGRLAATQYFYALSAWNRERLANTKGVRRLCRISRQFTTQIELAIMQLVGLTNAWGRSVLRPLAMLFINILLFSVIYSFIGEDSFGSSFVKSFEIGSIAGYDRGSAPNPTTLIRLVEWANLWTSLIFYTVFFATIVARICRVR